MKKTLALCLLTVLSFTVNAQTKEETIKYVEDQLRSNWTGMDIKVTPCEISVFYIERDGNNYQVIMPTDILKIDVYGSGLTEEACINAVNNVNRISIQNMNNGYSKCYRGYSDLYLRNKETDLIKLKKAIDHLASFCTKKNSDASINANVIDVDCGCPRPTDGYFVNIITLVENQDLSYRQQFREMACVNKTDSKEIMQEKVNCLWEKYYLEWYYTSTGFGGGNVLKYAIALKFEDFIDSMFNNFGINLSIKDPHDGKTLLDFVADEMTRFKGDKNYPKRYGELEKIYLHLKNDLNAKHANELTPQDLLPYRVKKTKITVSGDILKKYEGKYLDGNGYTPIYIKLDGKGQLLCKIRDDSNYFELSADSETSFFSKPIPAFAKSDFTFKANGVTGKYDLIWDQKGLDGIAKRID